MSMTRKHFESVASVIKSKVDLIEFNSPVYWILQTTAWDLATEFSVFNPNFSRATFMDACGFPGKVPNND